MKDGDIVDSIVGRLEQVILEAGVGKRQVRGNMAEICGISTQAIAHWFNGRTHAPSPDNIAAIAAFYHADLMWVITGNPNGPTQVQVMLKSLALEKEMAAQKTSQRKKTIQEARLANLLPTTPKKSKQRSLKLVVY